MSNLWEVATLYAMQTRLGADTVLCDVSTGLLGPNGSSNIRTYFAPPSVDPPGTTFPIIQIWPMSDTQADTEDTRILDTLLNLRVNVPKVTAVSGDDPLLTLLKIRERLIGDWPAHSTRVPTYGMDRWQMDFTGQTGDAASTYSATTMVYTGSNANFDDEDSVMRSDLNFAVSLCKAKA